MTQEDKELLIRDISARLPYGVKVKFTIDENIERNGDIIHVIDGEYSYVCNKKTIITYDNIKYVYNGFFDDVKPYLFPLSSMTEEQIKEFDQLIELELKVINDEIDRTQVTAFEIDFYNKHHLDWRGLIEKGLALDATGLNIY